MVFGPRVVRNFFVELECDGIKKRARVTSEEVLSRACRWQSWDGNPDLLSGEERDELRELVGSQNLWKVAYADLQAAADLLVEKYNKLWQEEYVGDPDAGSLLEHDGDEGMTEEQVVEKVDVSTEKLRAKTPQQMVEMIQQIDKLMKLRAKQGELLEELRRTMLLQWFGEEEKRKYLYAKMDGKITWEMTRKMQLKKLWERLLDWAAKGVDRR